MIRWVPDVTGFSGMEGVPREADIILPAELFDKLCVNPIILRQKKNTVKSSLQRS